MDQNIDGYIDGGFSPERKKKRKEKCRAKQDDFSALQAPPPVRAPRRQVPLYWFISLMVITAILAAVVLAVLWRVARYQPVEPLKVSGMSEENASVYEMLERVKNSTTIIYVEMKEGGTGRGTGTILTENGYIITNYHMISEAKTVTVYFYDGSWSDAQIIGGSEKDDIAVLKVAKTGLQPATFAPKDAIVAGERVYAIGNPGGISYAYTVTAGVVSYPERIINIYDDEGNISYRMHMIQTDATINHGNSGGALVNAAGEVLGIVSMKASTALYDDIGFAVPAEAALEVAAVLIRDGDGEQVISDAWDNGLMLGIRGGFVKEGKSYIVSAEMLTEADEAYIAEHPDDVFTAGADGFWIREVMSEEYPRSIVFRPNDILMTLGGYRLASYNDIEQVTQGFQANQMVPVTVFRNGKALRFEAKISERK